MYEWKPYVPAAERRRRALREAARLQKNGQPVSPVVVEGRTIARTFWGKAWCENLERYSDFENRLPRGRTYVRNGSVMDLQIAPAEVKALVSGSDIYRVKVEVTRLPRSRWTSICKDCAGGIDSLVELLQGHLSEGVMQRICQSSTGLFPAPSEISFSCSCPDWAAMCKHVAAVLYGIGARFDDQPELLFRLRNVDEKELISRAGHAVPLSRKGPAPERVLADDGLAELFGLDLGAPDPAPSAPPAQVVTKASRRRAAPTPSPVPVTKAPGPRAARAPSSAPATPGPRAARASSPAQATPGPRAARAPSPALARTRKKPARQPR